MVISGERKKKVKVLVVYPLHHYIAHTQYSAVFCIVYMTNTFWPTLAEFAKTKSRRNIKQIQATIIGIETMISKTVIEVDINIGN